MLIIVTSPVHTSTTACGVCRRRKGPSGVTVNAVLTTSGLSECLISMFAPLQKTSFIHFVPIICGYFHVIGVGNIYGRFHTLMFYSWIKVGYKRGNHLLLSILCTPLEYLIFCVGSHGRVVVYLQTCDIRSVL